MTSSAVDETRFGFGANWADYLETVDEERIDEAVRSLDEMIGRDEIAGRRWLDIGSGSGLFSLAAARLGASHLHSFDYDLNSVGCAVELRRREAVADDRWTVERGDALDPEYMGSLGQFDVVYSWGVLHHTGNMWLGIENAAKAVAPGGLFWIAIYNDQGGQSRRWARIKKVYNQLPAALRVPYTIAIMGPRELFSLAVHARRGQLGAYVRGWTQYKSTRGMSRWHDIVDWVGGYPFEVATPDEIFDKATELGFEMTRLVTRQGLGCNEFVFRRKA